MHKLARITFLTLALSAVCAMAAASPHGRGVLAGNHHMLEYQDGTPFFWLGDTAWLLFNRLDRAETERYLDDRQQKDFTVIQVMVLHGAATKSACGVPALLNENPATPNVTPGNDLSKTGEYDFWDHVDWVLDQAAQRGIFVALAPAWGSVVKRGELNAGNAAAYGKFLGRRYRSKPNVFWILGGDIRGDMHPDVWSALGRAIKAADPDHLMTFHPFGRTHSIVMGKTTGAISGMTTHGNRSSR